MYFHVLVRMLRGKGVLPEYDLSVDVLERPKEVLVQRLVISGYGAWHDHNVQPPVILILKIAEIAFVQI